MCHCRNILGLSSELRKDTSVLSAPFSHTDRSEVQSWPRCHHMALETLIYCCRRRNYFVPLSPEVGLCETCSSFPYSMLIGLPVACPGILFLAANLNMHLRFLFSLLKYDCDNFISTACTAPLVFKRQSDWLWVSGTWPWERYRLFMLWKPSVSGRCACARVWYSFVRTWQTQETVLVSVSLTGQTGHRTVLLGLSRFSWQLCPLSASLLVLFYCLFSAQWRVVDSVVRDK